MHLLRTILTYLVFAVATPLFLLHPKLRRGLAQRFGIYTPQWVAPATGPRIWLHGASAGDVLALRPTAAEIRRQCPSAQVVLSTITNSGMAMAVKLSDCFDAITYAPLDVPAAVKRALDQIDPSILVLEYTELWPQLIYEANNRGIPIVLHNGRFSEARLSRYRWLFWFTGNLLHSMSLLLMRDDNEAERAQTLGAYPQQIRTTGNTKFDNVSINVSEPQIAQLRRDLGLRDGELVWVAGSTHEGEEEALLDILVSLRTRHPGLKLIIAPRYTERADRIASLAARRDLTYAFRTRGPKDEQVLIVDTVGELQLCYSLATLVFVGGSFTNRGGQNIVEPAACGKPVLFGPHMENFSDAVQLLLGRGALQASTPEQLHRIMDDLLDRDRYRQDLGTMAQTQATKLKGAAKRNAEAILAQITEQIEKPAA